MSDHELRALEREILQAPASLDLRRRHARALQRAGDEERALAALDVAWRLGAEELFDELRAGCAARQLVVRGVTLCYVPGGPFAMGADDQDDDAAPLHVVHLSPFFVARDLLRWTSLDGWEERRWPLTATGANRERFLDHPVHVNHGDAARVIAHLAERAAAEGGPAGRWSLISEAQWERVARAAQGSPGGRTPYGVSHGERELEWTLDAYDPRAYVAGTRRDPVVVAAGDRAEQGIAAADWTELRVVRGVPLPAPVFATYREAARLDGSFEVSGWVRSRVLSTNLGIGVRPVFVPGAAPAA